MRKGCVGIVGYSGIVFLALLLFAFVFLKDSNPVKSLIAICSLAFAVSFSIHMG